MNTIRTPNFKKGDYYQSKNDIGYIDFISNDYVTLCVREIDRDERTAKNAVSKIIQVKVLVFPNEWENIKKLDQPNRHLTKSNKKAKHVDEWA